MFRGPRRSTPRVRAGRVQRKNSTRRTLDYYGQEMPWLVVDRQRPGTGCFHIARREEVRRFVELLPEWPLLTAGLNAIVLARAEWDCQGWHTPGVVALCAWDTLVWDDCEPWFIDEHRGLLDKLEVPIEESREGGASYFTTETAKAFSLVHVLVHELGHHHDWITSRTKKKESRGEEYAESYARRHEDVVLARYREEFGLG